MFRLWLPRFGRARSSLTRTLFVLLVLWPTVFYLFIAYVVPTSPALIPASLLLSKRPLLIVAHPDDESLFFGPTLLRLTQTSHKTAAGERKELRVLVLSSGEYQLSK
jgi:N-acetylglucosaminylphosphatidylinositol deacetylase